MADEDNKIIITDDDLNSDSVSQRMKEMEDAAKISLIRDVGSPIPQGKSNGGAMAILTLTGAGVLGGFIAFLLCQIVILGLLQNASNTVSNLGFTFSLAFAIGITVTAIDAASTRIVSKVGIALAIAFPTSIVIGLLIGEIANLFYSSAVESLYAKALDRFTTDVEVYAWMKNQLHLPRGGAWLLVGVAVGLTVGITSRSLKRTGLTVAGGAIGGFVGGAAFDFFPDSMGWAARLVGITFTGLLVGLSMALLEQAARTQWIEIIEGGMAGKQFILYKSDITLGSSPQADITLIKDSGIAPLHARIYAQGGRSFIESLNPGMPCTVDGVVGLRTPITDSSSITLGGTKIRFRERKGGSTVKGGVHTLSN